MSLLDDHDNLPTFEGVKDKTLARKMIDVLGGTSGIRTLIRDNLDGSRTMLRTRNGFPEFTTIQGKVETVASKLRGFVARVYGLSYGLLFWPVDMLARSKKYIPVEHGYYVAPFATTHNAAAAIDAHWNDVWTLTSAGKILINNSTYSGFGDVGSIGGMAGAIPYVIPKSSGDYGAEEDNNTVVKRIFAVGRTSVAVLASGSYEYPKTKLWPITPRNDGKAVTCGQFLDASDHTATMSQLWFTGNSWDALLGGWVISTTEVALLLTSPYMNRIDSNFIVEQSYAQPVSQGTTSATYTSGEGFPEVELWIVGVGEKRYTASNNYLHAIFPWRYAESRSVDGKRSATASNQTWLGSAASSGEIGGESIGVAQTNTLVISSRSETLGFDAISIDLPPVSTVSYGSETGEYRSPPPRVTWPTLSESINTVPRGASVYSHDAATLPGSASYIEKSQDGELNISCASGFDLVRVTFSKVAESGNNLSAVPVTGRYATPLANPYANVDSTGGFGNASKVVLQIIPMVSVPDDSILLPYLVEHADSIYTGGLCYDRWPSNIEPALYTTTSAARAKDDRVLHWETRDFILFDKREQVYIYILGEFDASSSDGESVESSLSVSLVVSSRLGEAREVLFLASLSFSELLPEIELTATIDYVPLPKPAAFFAPKHREQGGFNGAAYTTAVEEANGATPACLINFVLRLETYFAIGQEEVGSEVSFIPCNLLEMLYAYVFSQKYGMDTYERYPVDHAANFNLVMAGLFNRQHRVAYKDGAFVDWLDTFGGQYASQETQQLYRT